MDKRFRNNSFVNLTQLPLLCKNSGAVALVELGLTAGHTVKIVML